MSFAPAHSLLPSTFEEGMKETIQSFLICSFITITGMMLGGSILSFSLSGDPAHLLAGPFLILFGWFYLPLVFVAVAAGWLIYNPREWKRKKKFLFILTGGIIGCLVFDRIGIKGPEKEWNYSYRLAGYISGIFCYGAVVSLKVRSIREQIEDHFNKREQLKFEPDATGQRR